MRFLFLSNFFPRRRPAQAQTRPARTIWRLQYTGFCSCLSRNAKVGNPTDALRISKIARKRGGGVARLAPRVSSFSRALAVIGLSRGRPCNSKGGAPMSTVAAAAQTADRIDYWIPSACNSVLLRNPSLSKPSKFNPARDRRVGLLAIGQCLKDQYDALATPMPRHLAALVKQLEMQR